MREKKPVLLLASVAALTFALYEGALAAPPTAGSTAPPSKPPAAAAPAGNAATTTQGSTDTAKPTLPGPQESATPTQSEPAASPTSQPTSPATAPTQQPGEAAAGPMAMPPKPPLPPQMPIPDTKGAQAEVLSVEERIAQREQRFRKMRERFNKRRQEMMDRWDSYWKTLEGMTPEQKEAVEAVFGRARRGCSPWTMGPKMPRRVPMQPPFGKPDFGFPSGSGDPGQGFGYGPQGIHPFFNERAPTPSWGGEPPMSPGGVEPGHDMNPGFPPGPPPPESD